MAKSAVVRKTIKNMLGGVSQQPPLQRLESQCEEMINCVPSLTEFLKRRNGARFVSELTGSVDNSAFIGFIERGDSEAGIVTVDKLGNVTVYNLDGRKLGQAQCPYLISSNPKDDIKLCTVRDYNFLLNTKKTVLAEPKGTQTKPYDSLCVIKQVAYGETYYLQQTIDRDYGSNSKQRGFTVPATPEGEITAGYILTKLNSLGVAAEMSRAFYVCNGEFHPMIIGLDIPLPPHITEYIMTNGITKYSEWNKPCPASQCTGTLIPFIAPLNIDKLYKNVGVSANGAELYDSSGGALTATIKHQCKSFSELPVVAPAGYYVEVSGDPANNTDDYYLEFKVTGDSLSDGSMGVGGWVERAKWNEDTGLNNSTMPVVLKINSGSITIETVDWKKRTAGSIDTNPDPSFVNKTIRDIFFYKNRLGFITDDSVILSEAGEYFNFFQTTALALLDSDPIDIAVSGTKVSALKYVVPYAEALFIYTDRSLYALECGEVLSTASVELKSVLQFDTSLRAKPCVCDTSIYYAGRNGAYNQVREYNPTEKTDQHSYSNDITSHIPKYISGDIKDMLVSLEEGIMFLINSTDTVYCYSFIKDNGELLLSSWHKWKFTYPVIAGTLFQGWLYLVFKKPDNNLYLGRLAVSAADNLYKDETAINSSVNYISSYTYSPYYLRDSNGRVQDISTMIRTMSLKYSASSEFKIIINRKGRKQETRLADKKRYFTRFLAAGENKNITVRIESIEDKPFNIIETDLEVVYASRS